VTRRFALLTVFAAVSLAIVCVGGCGCNGSKSGGGTGFLVVDDASLKPDNLTLKEVSLELAGSKYKAEVKQTREGNQIQIDLQAFGEVIESERYESTEQMFSVVNAGGERYDPPISLIKYGMRVGDTWNWKGEIRTGPAGHEATAVITTSSEDLTVNGGTVHDVIKVEVALAIDSGRPSNPSTRKLKFWIGPKMGVVKREFGDYSKREPMGE
jgi:hypothetical protein